MNFQPIDETVTTKARYNKARSKLRTAKSMRKSSHPGDRVKSVKIDYDARKALRDLEDTKTLRRGTVARHVKTGASRDMAISHELLHRAHRDRHKGHSKAAIRAALKASRDARISAHKRGFRLPESVLVNCFFLDEAYDRVGRIAGIRDYRNRQQRHAKSAREVEKFTRGEDYSKIADVHDKRAKRADGIQKKWMKRYLRSKGQ